MRASTFSLSFKKIGTRSKCPRSECPHLNITMITQSQTRILTIILMPDPSLNHKPNLNPNLNPNSSQF